MMTLGLIGWLALAVHCSLAEIDSSADRGNVRGGDFPNTAVVFSWHVGNAISDTRWGHSAVGGEGNLFKMAVQSVRDTHPDMPIYLFTNGVVTDAQTEKAITVIKVDLAKEAGLDALLNAPNADAKVGFGTKLQAVRTGKSGQQLRMPAV